MNITSINAFAPNFLGRPKNRAPLYDKDNSFLNCCPGITVDTVAFSKPPSRKIETITDVIKNATINCKPRFSISERIALEKEARKFSSPVKTTAVLKELLNISYINNNGKKQRLRMVDIASFLSVTNFGTATEVNGVLNLIKADAKNNLINSSQSLDEHIFLPVENNPKLLTSIGKIEGKYKHLSPLKRGELISLTLDVIDASNGKFNTLALDIAKVINDDKHNFIYPFLIKGAESCGKMNFKKLLNSLTPENCEKIYGYYSKCTSSTEEDTMIENYVSKYTNNKL